MVCNQKQKSFVVEKYHEYGRRREAGCPRFAGECTSSRKRRCSVHSERVEQQRRLRLQTGSLINPPHSSHLYRTQYFHVRESFNTSPRGEQNATRARDFRKMHRRCLGCFGRSCAERRMADRQSATHIQMEFQAMSSGTNSRTLCTRAGDGPGFLRFKHHQSMRDLDHRDQSDNTDNLPIRASPEQSFALGRLLANAIQEDIRIKKDRRGRFDRIEIH